MLQRLHSGETKRKKKKKKKKKFLVNLRNKPNPNFLGFLSQADLQAVHEMDTKIKAFFEPPLYQ